MLTKESLKRYKYVLLVGCYIIICGLITIVGLQKVNSMVMDYNASQSGMVTSLLVENLNSEMNSLVEQFEKVAHVLLTADMDETELHESLLKYQEDSRFQAIGMIREDGTFLGLEGEKKDLEKSGYLKLAWESGSILITDPYRSSITGVHVVTMIVPVVEDGENRGMLYANLNLQAIADYANQIDVEIPLRICMLNSRSLNYIACSDMGDVPAGSWNSLLLKQEDMEFDDGSSYTNFVETLRQDVQSGTVLFAENQKEYTLGFKNIERMPNWYIVVVTANEDLSGVFTTFRGSVYYYMGLLLAITFVFAIALIMMELLQRRNFQTLATLDIMTGIYNKRTFESLVREFMVMAENRRQGYLIFVDVDDFKKYNDKYGHLNGDLVLKQFATCLKEIFSSCGYVGRYGGDEFVVFVKASIEKRAVEEMMAEARKMLNSIELEGTGPVPATFSAGGACYPADGMDYEELCKAADRAVYQVKEAGKDKFYWYR